MEWVVKFGGSFARTIPTHESPPWMTTLIRGSLKIKKPSASTEGFKNRYGFFGGVGLHAVPTISAPLKGLKVDLIILIRY